MSQKYKSKSARVCEVCLGALNKWYFNVRRRENREIIAQSEGYSRRIDCINTARLVTGGRLKISIIK